MFRPRQSKAPPPERHVIAVTLTGSRLLALPLFVALDDRILRVDGLRVRFGRTGVRIGPADSFPVDGVLAWRSDAVLITPGSDHSFRWADLKHWPELATAGLDRNQADWLKAVLVDHGVGATQVDFLSIDAARRLFAGGHLPWLVLPLEDAALLISQGAYAATFLGASTGPVPALIISGTNRELPLLLAALNQAEAIIRTTSARDLAAMVARDYPGYKESALQSLIATGQGLGLWPPTTFLGSDVYERGRALLAGIGVMWPDYSAGVRSAPELAALSHAGL